MTKMRAYAWRSLILAAGALVLAGLLCMTPVGRDIDRTLEDALLRLTAPVGDFSDVVVVDVDEPSMARLQSQIGAWPYDRDIYALVTPYLRKAGATVVVYDILFSEPRLGDDAFAATLDNKVVLAAASLPYGGAGQDASYRQRLATSALAHGPKWLAQSWEDLTLPLPKFTANATVGVISLPADPDGVVRSVPLLHRVYGEVLPALSTAVLKATGVPVQLDQATGGVAINGITMPLDAGGLVKLRYPRNFQSLRIVPFYEVALAASGSPRYADLAASLAGKKVFIGSSSAVLGDFNQTPLGRMAGLHHAAALPTMLVKGMVLQPRSWALDAGVTLLVMALALLLAYPRLQRIAILQVAALPALLLLVAGAATGLSALGYSSTVLMPALAGAFLHAGAVIWRQLFLYRKGRKLLVEKLAAEEATRLKSQFLSHMTHELRTPLTAILGFNNINWKSDALGRDERTKNAAVIDRNGRHLLALINGILDQAQLEAGQVRIVTRPESLRVLVGDVIASLKPLVQDKPILLDASYASGMPEAVEIDAFRVRQILINLTGNAIKFTAQGSVTLNVSWQAGALTIDITDTGPGMSPEGLSRLFAAFQQADDSIAAKHGGTGLGLTISRNLASLMQGSIEVTSELGAGSRFTLRLPAPVGLMDAASATSSASAASAAALIAAASRSVANRPVSEPEPGKPVLKANAAPSPKALHGTVLVAEDADDLRALAVIYLKRLGLNVLQAVNGREAVDIALRDHPDAILMDLEMPVLGGLDAVKALRAEGYSRPILATTAHTGEPHRTLALAAGCNDLLSKPISYSVLRAALDGAMSARTAPVAAGDTHFGGLYD